MDEQVKRGVGRPRTVNPNDPPAIETIHPAQSMPEQRVYEVDVAPPPSIQLEADKPEVKRFSGEARQDEAYIRQRVRRRGGWVLGFRTDGSEAAKVLELLKKYGRTLEQGWDSTMVIPGLDNAPHVDNQKHLFEKPVTVVQMADGRAK